MDDEESILRVTGRMLELLGYEVAFAHHGMEAVELYADALEKGSPFDAVIMDLTIRGGLAGKAPSCHAPAETRRTGDRFKRLFERPDHGQLS